MADGTIVIEIRADDKNALSKIDDLKKSVGTFGGTTETATAKVGSMVKALGLVKLAQTGFSMMKNSLDSAISRFDILQNSGRVFENMGFEAKETSATMDALSASIKGLPTPMESAVQSVQMLASSTKDLSGSQEIYASLNNAVIGFGGSNEMVERTVQMFARSLQKGKVSGDEFNTMMDTMGPVMNAVAEEMGMTTAELQKGLSDGSIDINEFKDTLIKLNEEGGGGLVSLEQIARDATGGIGTSLANVQNAINRGMAAVIEKTNEALEKNGLPTISEMIQNFGKAAEEGLTRAADSIGPIIDKIGELKEAFDNIKESVGLTADTLSGFFENINPWAAGLIGFAGTIALVTAATFAFNTILGLVPAVAGAASLAYTAVGVALLSINWPLVLIAAAIGAVIAIGVLMYQNWEIIKEKAVELGEKISEVWQAMISWFETLPERLSETFTNAVTRAALWKEEMKQKAIEAATEFINGVITYLSQLPGRIGAWLSNAMAGVSSWASEMLQAGARAGGNLKDGVVSSIKAIPGILYDNGRAIIDGFIDGMTAAWERGKEFVSGIADWIKDHKGPISYDRKLLTGAGEAIMSGLNKGLASGFENVKANVSQMANSIKSEIGAAIEPAAFDDQQLKIEKAVGVIGTINGYIPQISAAGQTSRAAVTNNKYDNNKTIKVEVKVDGSHIKDERELARELKLQMQRLGYSMA